MLTLLLTMFSLFQTQAADSVPKDESITLNLERTTLKHAISVLEKQTPYRFFFNHKAINVSRKVNVRVSNAAIEDVLNQLCGTDIAYNIQGKQIVLRKARTSAATIGGIAQPDDTAVSMVETMIPEKPAEEASPEMAALNISGTVLDETGGPLPGVNVIVKGTTIGTVTDADGKFVLSVPDENADGTLVFSFIGYNVQEVGINGQSSVRVTMAPDIKTLNEVVVVGTSMKEKDLTGAVVNVNEKTLSERPVTSINEALQGRATGVFIQNNPEPGGSATIRIRGNNSMQFGASPIYVVDGIVMERDFNMVNLNDVASISVLKDASSTALYGSRGANGVVIITTKKGRNGESRIAYDAWVGVQDFTNANLTLGAKDMFDLRIEAFENSHVASDYYAANPTATRQDFINNELLGPNKPWFADYEKQAYANGDNYNWLDEVTRSAVQQNHSLSFSGGTEKSSYFLSFGYSDQEGIVKSSGYKRYTGRINAEQSLKPWLKIGTNTSFTRTTEDLVDGKVFAVARGANPLLSPAVDSLILAWGNKWDIDQENPIKSMTIDKDRSKNKIFTSNYVNINPIKGLNIRSTLTADLVEQEYYEYIPIGIQQARRESFRGRAVHNFDHISNFQWDNSISYEKQFDKHLITGLVSTSMSRNQYKWTNVAARDFPTNDFGYYNLGAAFDKDNFVLGSDITQSSLMSYLGRVNYEYDGKYLATVTARYDGSSKFAEGHKWGVFPSVALGWNIAEETFMDGQRIFEIAKLRVGYGSVGNQNIPDYSFNSLYSPSFSGGNVSFNSTGLRGTSALTWEKQNQLNVGIDLGTLNNRIQFSADYFDIVNSNLLMRRSLSPLTGYNEAIVNIGEMTNKGFEFSLKGLVIDTEDLKWDVAVNYSSDKNRITSLYGNVDAIYKFGGFSGAEIQREGNFFLGQSINTIYMWEFDRIIQEEDMEYVNGLTLPGKTLYPGDILPKDQQAEGEPGHGVIDENDRVNVGKKDPKFYGGITSQLSWKGISLNAVFTYSYGAKAVSGYYESLMNGTGITAAHKDMLNRWTPENTGTNIPRATYDNSSRFGAGETSWGIQDASYLRLSTLTLAYDLPSSLVERVGLKNFRIYTTANNLGIWTKYKGYDPEGGDWYPTARMFVAGLNLGF